jgi:hypothetical protein
MSNRLDRCGGAAINRTRTMFGFIEPDFDQHDWWLIEPEPLPSDVEEHIIIYRVADQIRHPVEAGAGSRLGFDQ